MNGSFGAGALEIYTCAARVLGWRPEEFWRATPAELASALQTPGRSGQPIGRDELNRLMEQDNG